MRARVIVCLGVAVCCGVLCAQEAERSLETRSGQIEARREQKAQRLKPDKPPKYDRILQAVKKDKIIEHIIGDSDGWRPEFGGLVTYSGFAAGPGYVRHFADDRVRLHAGGTASLRDYYKVSAGVTLPKLFHDFAFLDFSGGHLDYPNIDYYGPGPHSAKSGRSGYRLVNSWAGTRGGVRPAPHLSVGGLGRFLAVDLGPTGDSRFTPTTQVFSEAAAPGLTQPSNFFQGGAFAQYDYRDYPGEPRRGGNYTAEISNYSDLTRGLFSFRRMDFEAQQYIPFFNESHVIALRGHATFTNPYSGNQVPFYLEPELGGPDSLRGFRPFRFYDRNAVILNGEYRWAVFSGLDMALFVDAGQVFHRVQDFSAGNFETSYGFGFRFKVHDSVFLRVDTGFSREGAQIWLKFNNIF